MRAGSLAWPLAAAGLVIPLWLFWWPATGVPFWQDDYDFLINARDAGAASSWLSWLVPDPPRSIWRPIGAGAWWWAIHDLLGGNARAAHVAGLAVLVMSAAAVGWLASTIGGFVAPDQDRRWAAIVAGLLYGLHGAHLLPVAWTSAANDSMAVLFGALALRYWIVGSLPAGGSGLGALAAALLFLILALFSRESAVVIPVLAWLVTMWLRSGQRPTRTAWAVGAVAVLITAGWWLAHAAFSVTPQPVYQLHIGVNVFRNAGSLLLFAFNTPREALRFLLIDPSPWIFLWAAACFVTQAGVVLLLMREARSRLNRRTATFLATFFAIACAPYVLLGWNSYEYYVSFGLLAYAILAAIAARRSRTTFAAIFLAALSSGLFVTGNFGLDSPALIARAEWGERQLRLIERWRAEEPLMAGGPLFVRIEHPPRFQAMGAAGLAYRLGLDSAMIVPVGPADAPPGRVLLVVPEFGDVYLKR